MKTLRIISSLAALAVSVSAFADDPVKDFSSRVSGSRVSFSYKYEMNADVRVTGRGNAIVQGDSFKVDVDGMEMISDGKTRWTVDSEAKEIVIEKVEGTDFVDNPILIVTSFENSFKEISRNREKVQGRDCLVVDFAPVDVSGIATLAMVFSGNDLVRVVVGLEGGATTIFDVSDMKFLYPENNGMFSYDLSALDSTWVKTDLR